MNKNDLISSVAESSGLTKADAGRAVDGVFDSIASALASGDDVRIVGFGSFSVANRAASTGEILAQVKKFKYQLNNLNLKQALLLFVKLNIKSSLIVCWAVNQLVEHLVYTERSAVRARYRPPYIRGVAQLVRALACRRGH